MARRTKRKVEKSLMVVDTKREIIDILQITNRRFMYNPQTGILILGDEAYGKSIAGSHAQEFYDSQAGGCFDDYLRGWIGTSKSYPRGSSILPLPSSWSSSTGDSTPCRCSPGSKAQEATP